MQRKHFIPVLLCSVAILASCTDVWEEHYQSDPLLNGEETLWELIENDPDLDKFEEFLLATGYDTLLKKDRFYTVWAPVGDFAYNESDSSLWEKEFVQNHIANYSHVAGGKLGEDNFVTMLNGKFSRFENTKGSFTFKGLPLQESNIAAKNGILHKIEGYAAFLPNIWEQLAKEEGIDSLYQFLFKDFKREFNQYQSVVGPTIDGKVTYLDSVFTESNPWFYDLGELDREDSSYTMFALTNRAWEEMYASTSTYFRYASAYGAEGDSISEAIVRELMCKNLVFSDKVNAKYRNGSDKVPYDKLLSNYKLYYGMKDPLAFEGDEVAKLYEGAVTKQLSNGTLHIVDQVNYEPIKCWHDTIRLEAEYLTGKSASDTETPDNSYYETNISLRSVIRIDEDSVSLYNSVSGGAVASFEPINPNDAFDLCFLPKNILSAPYKIKVVVLPPQVINPLDTAFIRPSMFTANLVWGNDTIANATSVALKLGVASKDTIITNPAEIDTIELCPLDGSGRDYVEIPVCEFEEAARLKDAKTQTKLTIHVCFPNNAGTYKNQLLNAATELARFEVAVKNAKNALAEAEKAYEAALSDPEADADFIDDLSYEVEEKQRELNQAEGNLLDYQENKLPFFIEQAKYDTSLRIDQVIFEPVDLKKK